MSGQSFEKEVKDAIEKRFPQDYALMFSKALGGMKGVSGNDWQSDIVIERIKNVKPHSASGITYSTFEMKGVRAVIECKESESLKPAIYRNQMLRAYGQLGDLRNLSCPRFLVVRRKVKSNSKFDFDSYFRTIGVKMVDWSSDTEREEFLDEVEHLVRK